MHVQNFFYRTLLLSLINFYIFVIYPYFRIHHFWQRWWLLPPMLTLHLCKYQGGEDKLLVLLSMGGKLTISVLWHMRNARPFILVPPWKYREYKRCLAIMPLQVHSIVVHRAPCLLMASTEHDYVQYSTILYNITLFSLPKGLFWDNLQKY